MNLTNHRKSACCLRLLIFREIWVIAPLWYWRSQDFPKDCCQHDLKAFCERAWRTEDRIKYKKSSLNFIFGQGSCFISDFARLNSNKAVLVQLFLRFEIVIFSISFVFFMMNSICNMAWVAGWILEREIIKSTNVFYAFI